MFYGTMAGTVGWSKAMVENQVQVLLGSERNVFPAVLGPTVNWELVDWHEGKMDAVYGISVFDHFVVGVINSPPTV